MAFTVYLLANRRNGALYIGYTDDLYRRMIEHRGHHFRGFTDRYDITRLVWFEEHDTRESAFLRERRLKTWRRSWKLELIERDNPEWRDLALEMGWALDTTGSSLSRG